jgi:hypothetical protein
MEGRDDGCDVVSVMGEFYYFSNHLALLMNQVVVE